MRFILAVGLFCLGATVHGEAGNFNLDHFFDSLRVAVHDARNRHSNRKSVANSLRMLRAPNLPGLQSSIGAECGQHHECDPGMVCHRPQLGELSLPGQAAGVCV